MANVNVDPQTPKAKKRRAKRTLKQKRADIDNFASLSTPEKWALLADILPQIQALLDEEDES